MTDPVDLSQPSSPEPRRLVWLALLLLGLAWGVVVPVLAAQAALTTATFFGSAPQPGALSEQHERFGDALAVGSSLVALGFTLSVWGRSNGGGWTFALLAVPTLLLGLCWLGTVPPQLG